MSNHKLTYTMTNPKLNSEMIKDAYEITDYIEWLECIEHDEVSSQERRQAAADEKGHQLEDLEKLKTLMRNNRSGFTRIIYYKYIEGYSLQEVADVLRLHHGTVANAHARFTSYLNNPEKYKPKKKPNIKKVIKALDELLNPKYEIECITCGCLTEIPHEVVNKIYNTENKKRRVGLSTSKQT